MQTQPYSLAKERFAALTGIQNLSAVELEWFRSSFNRRARTAYAAATYWPRFMVTSQKRVVGSYGLVSWQGPTSIMDTVLRVTQEPQFRSASAGDYEWVANGEGIRVLRHPDSERGYLSNVYELTGEDSKQFTPNVKFASVSFWVKGTTVVGFLNYLFQSRSDAPFGAADGGVTFSDNGVDIVLANGFVNDVGTSVTWYIDGVNVGVDFGTGDQGVAVGPYLDGQWHNVVGVISQPGVEQIVSLAQVGDAANDGDLQVADIRWHKRQLTQDDAIDLYNAPDSLTGSEVAIYDTTPVYATFLADFAASYGDLSGDESNVPKEWFEYCVHGAYADWLRAERQADKAMAEDAFANGLLVQELDRMERAGRTVTPKFSTHKNRQGR